MNFLILEIFKNFFKFILVKVSKKNGPIANAKVVELMCLHGNMRDLLACSTWHIGGAYVVPINGSISQIYIHYYNKKICLLFLVMTFFCFSNVGLKFLLYYVGDVMHYEDLDL